MTIQDDICTANHLMYVNKVQELAWSSGTNIEKTTSTMHQIWGELGYRYAFQVRKKRQKEKYKKCLCVNVNC